MSPQIKAELETELWENAVTEHLYCMQSGLSLIQNDLGAFSKALYSLL
jgi:hypothetical protein